MRLVSEEVRAIAPGDIVVTDRVRPVDRDTVEMLKQSILQMGHIASPLHLRKGRKSLELIDGYHRLSAAISLDLDTVPALIWDCRQDEARFLEADANVSTVHATPLDLAMSLAARKSAYETLYPQTRQHVAGGYGKHLQARNLSFAEYASKAMGVSKRQLERVIAAGRSITAREAEALRSAPRRVSYSDLEAIAKVGDAKLRGEIIARFQSGEAKTLRAALPGGGAKAVSADPVEKAFQALCRAWDRAPRPAQKRFLDYAKMSQQVARDGGDK